MARSFGLVVARRDLVAFDPLPAHPAPPQSWQLKFKHGMVRKCNVRNKCRVFNYYCGLWAAFLPIIWLGRCAPCHLQKTATPPGILKRRLARGNKLNLKQRLAGGTNSRQSVEEHHRASLKCKLESLFGSRPQWKRFAMAGPWCKELSTLTLFELDDIQKLNLEAASFQQTWVKSSCPYLKDMGHKCHLQSGFLAETCQPPSHPPQRRGIRKEAFGHPASSEALRAATVYHRAGCSMN